MTIQIYNTLTRKKEPFETLESGIVKMYVCGPTVYSDAHLGHAMSITVMDIIRRYLEYRGYAVEFVMNYTDVNDKITNRAILLGKQPLQLAQEYIDEYDSHLHDLNIESPTAKPRVSNLINEIIDFVQGLIDKGFAYAADDGSVYFRVEKKDDYGKLSGRKLADMAPESRVDTEDKEHPADFAIWKADPDDAYAYDSPWGKGNPGWHIECSCMSRQILGDQIDIHGGGNDLIFPHHENEIAQSEALTEKPFVRYWVHNGMMNIDGQKGSKSEGNIYEAPDFLIKDFLKKYDADIFRLIILNASYRKPIEYSYAVIEQAQSGLDRLLTALRSPAQDGSNAEADATLNTLVENVGAEFIAAMNDDFNTAKALAGLYELVRGINQAKDNGGSANAISAAQDALRELADVLGLRLREPELNADAAPFIEMLLDLRQTLRKEKLFALADQIRNQLGEHGVVVEDSAQGSTWRYKG